MTERAKEREVDKKKDARSFLNLLALASVVKLEYKENCPTKPVPYVCILFQYVCAQNGFNPPT